MATRRTAQKDIPEVRDNLPFQAGILAYRGGKSYLARQIVASFPPHARYCEPFFGSGAVFFAKQCAPYEVVNDLDRTVTTFFQCLRDQPSNLIAQLWATPYSREEFALAVQEADNLSPLEQARAFFIRCNQGFAGKATSASEGNWGTFQNLADSMLSKWKTHIALLAGTAERLRGTVIEHQDFEKVIRRYATPDMLVYADPPYMPETRTQTRDYRHEMTTADHERLLRVLTATGAMVALSGYDSPMYRDMLTGWHLATFDVPAHSAGRVGKRKGQASPRRTECLWRNPAAMAAINQQRSLWEAA